jgi:hypothetical protein
MEERQAVFGGGMRQSWASRDQRAGLLVIDANGQAPFPDNRFRRPTSLTSWVSAAQRTAVSKRSCSRMPRPRRATVWRTASNNRSHLADSINVVPTVFPLFSSFHLSRSLSNKFVDIQHCFASLRL